MGDYSYFGEDRLNLITALSNAAAASNTRLMLVQRIGEVFASRFPLKSFELGWCDDIETPQMTVGIYDRAASLNEVPARLIPKDIHRILQTGRAEHEGRLITLPLSFPGSATGYIRITLTADVSPETFTTPLVEAIRSILAFAQHHCRLVERISKLSSTAYQENRGLREELRRYTEPGTIVARSDSMRHVLESVALVARHDTAVLLRGESGTGKELLARRIHQMSLRARRPFVAINCGAFPETLIESELFGHEKGAFTGASNRYRGRFERSNHGTIFLDEIGDLPLSAQVKLLRVLQEGEFERLGGEETVRVNVRILAATNRPLESMMESGSFRPDLFFRINVFPIRIPPLRERIVDIPILARTLLADTSKRLGIKMPSMGAEVTAKLTAASWPGNVRELSNVLERSLIMSNGRDLQISGLNVAVASEAKPENAEQPHTFDDGARQTIQRALAACNGKIYGSQGAAKRLGIPPSTLQGKMRRLGIPPGSEPKNS